MLSSQLQTSSVGIELSAIIEKTFYALSALALKHPPPIAVSYPLHNRQNFLQTIPHAPRLQRPKYACKSGLRKSDHARSQPRNLQNRPAHPQARARFLHQDHWSVHRAAIRYRLILAAGPYERDYVLLQTATPPFFC